MNRENFLFALCGLLGGFILGYFVANRGPSPSAAPGSSPAPAGSAAAAGGSGAGAPISTSPEMLERVKELRAALDKDAQNVELQKQLADTYYDMNNWSEAANWYEKVLPQKKTDANLLTDLGSCYRNLGKFDRAVEMYETAQKVSPSHPQSLLNLTLVYTFDLKDAAKAQKALDRLKKEHPEIPRLEDLQSRISSLRASQS